MESAYFKRRDTSKPADACRHTIKTVQFVNPWKNAPGLARWVGLLMARMMTEKHMHMVYRIAFCRLISSALFHLSAYSLKTEPVALVTVISITSTNAQLKVAAEMLPTLLISSPTKITAIPPRRIGPKDALNMLTHMRAVHNIIVSLKTPKADASFPPIATNTMILFKVKKSAGNKNKPASHNVKVSGTNCDPLIT